MAIYEPPKQTSLGATLNAAGDVAVSAGGLIGTATGFTGVGAIAGGVVAGLGAVAKLAGTIVSGNQEKALNEYNNMYNMRVQGEESLAIHKANNEQYAGLSSGVGASLSQIQAYIEPQSGGTGLINQRLI